MRVFSIFAILAILFLCLFVATPHADAGSVTFFQSGAGVLAVPNNAVLLQGGCGVGVPAGNFAFVGGRRAFVVNNGLGNNTVVLNRGGLLGRRTFFQSNGVGGTTFFQDRGFLGLGRRTVFQQNAVGGGFFFAN